MIDVHDILDFLVAKSAAPSTMGAQLDRLRFGVQFDSDPVRARKEAEDRLLQQAALIRCIDAFAARQEFAVTTRQRTASYTGYKVLEKIAKAARARQGEVALGILRAYHERCTSIGASESRGLLEVYNYCAAIAPSAVPKPPKNETDLLTAFRTGGAKRARNLACEAYADALLALQNFVRVWNKEQKAKERAT